MEKIAKSLLAMMLIAAISLCYGTAPAQTYPTKPIRLIIPFAAGGSNDIIGRLIATHLTKRLGQQIIVENPSGAGGLIGTEIVAKSAPDGYTLVLVSAAFTVEPAFYKLPYDPVKAFDPVSKVPSANMLLVVHPSVPANSLKDFIALAKKEPGKLNVASAGYGSYTHMGIELFKHMAGIDFKIVQFKGGGPATIDTLGGHSDAAFGTIPQFLPHVKSGKLKALGTLGSKRSIALPDVPTLAEAGVPGYEASSWLGILAPAGTPQAIVDRLNKEITAIMSSEEKQFLAQGAEVDKMPLAEMRPFIAREIAKWGQVVKEAKIKVSE